MSDPSTQADGSLVRRRPVWREVVYIVGVYLAYSTVRNHFGSAGGAPGHANGIAFGHATDVIDFERSLKLFFEPHVQSWYLDLPAHGFIQVWNIFYGTAHFIITAVALVWLFLRDPERYPRWRNTLACTTLLALIGFAAFSLMPPRLLDKDVAHYGPPTEQHFGFVDTLEEFPTIWSFDSGGLKKLSNQYAAMPSLHMGWSAWSALVLFPLVRRRWARALVALYPAATFFCIVVTANHFWLDAAIGALVLATGYVIGSRITEFWQRRETRSLSVA